jgi:hypothetical protein
MATMYSYCMNPFTENVATKANRKKKQWDTPVVLFHTMPSAGMYYNI